MLISFRKEWYENSSKKLHLVNLLTSKKATLVIIFIIFKYEFRSNSLKNAYIQA